MKAIIIGDPHIKTDNFEEFELFVQKLTEKIVENKPDIIVILGDVLHTHERLHTLALNKAYDFIKKMATITKTYVLVGNHDYCSNQEFLTTNHWMNCMKEWQNLDLIIVDNVIYDNFENTEFLLCPYVPNGRFIEALEKCEKDWKSMDIIFAHQEFKGCKMGAIISEDGDEWCEQYPNVISGHIHSNQKPQKNIYYPGSAMQIAFGESEKNIIAMIEINKKKYKLDELQLNLPRKKIIYMDIQNVEEYNVDNKNKDKIKVSVSGNYEEFKVLKKSKKYKNLVSKGVKVVFKPKKIEEGIVKKEYLDSEMDFKTILHDIISKEKDKQLMEMFTSIINGNV